MQDRANYGMTMEECAKEFTAESALLADAPTWNITKGHEWTGHRVPERCDDGIAYDGAGICWHDESSPAPLEIGPKRSPVVVTQVDAKNGTITINHQTR